MSKMRFTKEIKIALVGVVGIVVCYFGLNFLKGLPIFSTDTIYYITFDDVKGMGVSTPSMPTATRWAWSRIFLMISTRRPREGGRQH